MLEEYEVKSVIARGRYGKVYLGVHVNGGDKVAIKKLGLNMSEQQMKWEVSVLERLKKVQHCAQMISHCFMKGRCYVMMELYTPIYAENCGVACSKYIVHGLLYGIKCCHELGIIHRDIKLDNVMVDEKEQIRIIDFGNSTENVKDCHTIQVGHRYYKAPELLFGCKQYDTKMDIWSIGCVFAELVGHEVFLKGESDIQQLVAIFKKLGSPQENQWQLATEYPCYLHFNNQNPLPLQKQFPNLSKNGVDLLSKMLTLDPLKRISAEEVTLNDYD